MRVLVSIVFRVNVTTGYTLFKTRHSRLTTYLQRETDTADWLRPTFTLPCLKNGWVYPRHVYFSPELYPDFPKCTLTWREVGPLHRLFHRHESLSAPSKGHQNPNLPAWQTIASLGGRSAPTKEHQNINSSIFKQTMAYHQKSFQSNSDLIHEFCI